MQYQGNCIICFSQTKNQKYVYVVESKISIFYDYLQFQEIMENDISYSSEPLADTDIILGEYFFLIPFLAKV